VFSHSKVAEVGSPNAFHVMVIVAMFFPFV